MSFFLSLLVIPVKLGIIGVMNRSQLDINNKKVSVMKKIAVVHRGKVIIIIKYYRLSHCNILC